MSLRPLLPRPTTPPDSYESRFNTSVARELTKLGNDVQNMYSGRLVAYTSAAAAPTGGAYAQGDIVRNNTPAVAGLAGSQYVIIGWICTVAGNPGTWVEMRTLTGT